MKLALVIGNIPSAEEIEQFQILGESFDVSVISSTSICEYLDGSSHYQDLTCFALEDFDENPSYLPGLETVLSSYDVVVVKGRMSLYSYQALKAKWKSKFRLVVWVDNLKVLPAEDVDQMRATRIEVTDAADAFIVNTKSAKDTLLLEGVEDERIHYFRPWVQQAVERNGKTRAKAREAIGLAEGNIVIGFIGPLEWEEGLNGLIAGVKKATMESKSLNDQLRVVFCGAGSFAGSLQSNLVKLGIDDRVTFLNPNRGNLSCVLEAVDCLYYAPTPSQDRIDGDPFRVLSAMVNGIPLLATRSAMIDEFCGKHRLDICANSPSSFVKTLSKVSVGSSLVKDIVRKNKETIQNLYSKDSVRQNVVDTFNEIACKSVEVTQGQLDSIVADVESLVSSKQYLKAIDHIENIFKLGDVPIHHEANLLRLVGDCFTKLADYDGAKDAYARAIELDGFAYKAYIGLGTVGLLTNSHDISVLHFQKAVTLMPNDEMPFLGLGLAFQGLGESIEAMKWMEKSLGLNRTNSAAIYSLVKVSYELGKFETAENAINTYLNIHPNDPNMLFTKAGIFYKQNREDECREVIHKVLQINPHNENAINLLKKLKGDGGNEKAKVVSQKG